MKIRHRLPVILIALLALSGCRQAAVRSQTGSALRLATTTSTYDSGLLDAILPDFESRTGTIVEVVAVGTGQALEIGRSGDADVVLVHAPEQEIAFVEAGFGTDRFPVMFNDFVIVGPEADPADVARASSAAQALSRIRQSSQPFASRGDNSGTHTKEITLWELVGGVPESDSDWYFSLGQGMGETLNFAEQKDAYTLTDRGTFLALSANLPHLSIQFGGASPGENPDPNLYNFYSVIPVNPELRPRMQATLALDFVDWLRSPQTQQAIADFGTDRFGLPLFFPNADGAFAP